MNKLALLLLPLFVAGPAFAGGPRIRGQRNVYHEEHCYKNVEKYIPGHYDDYGNYRRGRVKVRRKKYPAVDIIMDQSTCLSLLLILSLDMKTQVPTWVVWMIIPVQKEP